MLSYWKVLLANVSMPFNQKIFLTAGGKKLWSGTEAFDAYVRENRAQKAREEFASLLEPECVLIDYPTAQCFSCGCRRLPLISWGQADSAIFMTEGLYEADPDAYRYLVRHEASHIRSRDVWVGSLLTYGVFLGGVYWASLRMGVLGQMALGAGGFLGLPYVGAWLEAGWMYLRELAADQFAQKRSTADELRGAIRYFTAVKRFNASIRDIAPQYDEEGESVVDYKHPSTTSRIERLQQELEKRREGRYPVGDVTALVEVLRAADQKHLEILKML